MRFRSLVLLVAGPLALSACQDEAPLEENADEADRAAMRAAERAVMNTLGFPSDDAPHEFGA